MSPNLMRSAENDEQPRAAADSDWAHRRNPKACKLCRIKKVRCNFSRSLDIISSLNNTGDGTQPACGQCRLHKSQCVYLPRAKRSTKARSRGGDKEPPFNTSPPAARNSQVIEGAPNRPDSTVSFEIERESNNETSNNVNIDNDISNSNHNSNNNGSTSSSTSSSTSDVSANVNSISHGNMATGISTRCSCGSGSVSTGSTGSNRGKSNHVYNHGHKNTAVPQNSTSPAGLVHLRTIPHDRAEGSQLTSEITAEPPQGPHLDAISIEDYYDPAGLAAMDVNFNHILHDLGHIAIPGSLDEVPSGHSENNNDRNQNVTEICLDGMLSDQTIAHNAMEPLSFAAVEEDIGHSLQRTRGGHLKYMGPCMSFLPATRIGQQWITHVTGSDYFSTQLHEFLANWTPKLPNNSISESQCYKNSCLPSISAASAYVNAYFESVEGTFPVLDRESFLSRFHETFRYLSPTEDPTWCSLVNIVLAIGCRATPGSNDDQVCALFGNSLCLFSKVLLGISDMLKIQTLTLMYLFLSYTTAPHWGYTILSCAVREGYAIGLHLKTAPSWGFCSAEVRQRELLLWTLYCLDSHLMFRIGRPPTLRRGDITVNLPDLLEIDENVGNALNLTFDQKASKTRQRELFIANIKLSHLLHEANDLISRTADLTKMEEVAVEYERKVSLFCSSLNPQFVIDTSMILESHPTIPSDLRLPILTLNTSIFIARWIVRIRVIAMKMTSSMRCRWVQHPFGTIPSLQEDFDKACDAAAAVVELVSNLPKDQVSFNWYLQPLPVYALYILFSAIIYNPAASNTAKYMELISVVVESTVHGVGGVNPLMTDDHLTNFLTFFARTARMAIRNWRSAVVHQGISAGMIPSHQAGPATPLDVTMSDSFALHL